MNASRMAVGVLALVCATLAGGWIVTATHARALRVKLEQAERLALHAHPKPRSALLATDKEKLLQRLLDERVAAYAKLQAELDALRKESAAPSPQPLAATTNPGPTPAENRNSWLERLRTEDPARYKPIQEEREQRRQRVEAMFRDQLCQNEPKTGGISRMAARRLVPSARS